MTDSNITNYLGVGLASALPSSPSPPSGGTELYYETDTGLLKVWTGSAWNTVAGAANSRPALSAFSWFAQQGATASDISGGPLVIRDTNDGNNGWHGLVKAAPSADFTLIAQLGAQGPTDGSNGPLWGFIAVNSSNELTSFQVQLNDASQSYYDQNTSIIRWSAYNSYNGTVVRKLAAFANPLWMKLQYTYSTGTFVFSISIDGYDYDEVGTETLSAFLSSFAYVGFAGNFDNTASSSSSSVRLYNWSGV